MLTTYKGCGFIQILYTQYILLQPLTSKKVKQDPMINQVLQPVKRFIAGFMGVLVDSMFKFAEQPMILQVCTMINICL